METFTLDEVMSAAKWAGVGKRACRLREELGRLAATRYCLGNTRESDYAVRDMACQEWVRGLYETMHDWREVGAVIGMSAAYAWRVAHGTLRPNRDVIARFEQERAGG